MRVHDVAAPEIGLRHQLGQLSGERGSHFPTRFAQLRGDERQAQRHVDFLFRSPSNDAVIPRQAFRVQAQSLAAGLCAEGFEMGIGAGREQHSDSKAFRSRDVNDQLIALLDRPVATAEVRVDSNQRESVHEFGASAEFTLEVVKGRSPRQARRFAAGTVGTSRSRRARSPPRRHR